jgi:integrase
MAVRTVKRRGERRLVIDIRYTNSDGTPGRFRRDAEVQTVAAAHAEDRRRLAALATTGTPEGLPPPAVPPIVQSNPVEVSEPIVRPTTPAFGETVKDYLATFAPSNLKPSTKRGYEAILKGFLLPRLRSTPIGEIDAATVRRLDVELVARGVTPSTRRQMHAVLRSVLFKHAVESGLLTEAPRFPKLPKAGRKIVRALTQEEFARIEQKACPAHRLAFLLAAHAGLRAGEIRGLRWKDVDLKSGHIIVRRSICYGVAATPKSGHERVVPLTPILRAALEAVISQDGNAVVSTSKRGTPWKSYALRQAFVRVAKKAGIEGWRFHDLRHLFVTSLFRAGAPAPAVQALAGHAHLATTERYAHLVRVDLDDAIARLSRAAGVTGG